MPMPQPVYSADAPLAEPGAAAILSDWLPLAATRMALRPAERLAAALNACGLVGPHRHAEATSFAQGGGAGHADRGLQLVQ
jgi:hypothetical protein